VACLGRCLTLAYLQLLPQRTRATAALVAHRRNIQGSIKRCLMTKNRPELP
jgi:hypothetical protein